MYRVIVYIVVSCKGAGDYIASIDRYMFIHVPSSFTMDAYMYMS